MAFVVRVRGSAERVHAVFDAAAPGLVSSVTGFPGSVVEVRLAGEGDQLGPQMARVAAENSLELLEMRSEEPSLEDVFRSMTIGKRQEVAGRA